MSFASSARYLVGGVRFIERTEMLFPDHEYCYMTIHYKSGNYHVFDTTVARARKLSQTKRRAARFIKVIIPDPNSRRIAVFLWTPESKWTRTDAVSRV